MTVLLLDGGLATELERKGIDLSIGKLWSARILDECPELVYQVHLSYLEAGANIITSCSYQVWWFTSVESISIECIGNI